MLLLLSHTSSSLLTAQLLLFMDYKGQKLSEDLYQLIVILFSVRRGGGSLSPPPSSSASSSSVLLICSPRMLPIPASNTHTAQITRATHPLVPSEPADLSISLSSSSPPPTPPAHPPATNPHPVYPPQVIGFVYGWYTNRFRDTFYVWSVGLCISMVVRRARQQQSLGVHYASPRLGLHRDSRVSAIRSSLMGLSWRSLAGCLGIGLSW